MRRKNCSFEISHKTVHFSPTVLQHHEKPEGDMGWSKETVQKDGRKSGLNSLKTCAMFVCLFSPGKTIYYLTNNVNV